MNTTPQIESSTQTGEQPSASDNRPDSTMIARRFLSALYPERFNLQGSIGITSKARGFSVGDAGWFPATQTGLNEAARQAARMGTDVYYHVSTHDPDEAKRTSQSKKEQAGKPWNGGYRGHIESATQLTFLWADIDLQESVFVKEVVASIDHAALRFCPLLE
jgi:hypothetical protein